MPCLPWMAYTGDIVMGAVSVSLKIYAMCNIVLTDTVKSVRSSRSYSAPSFRGGMGPIDAIATLASTVGMLFVTRSQFLFPKSEAEIPRIPCLCHRCLAKCCDCVHHLAGNARAGQVGVSPLLPHVRDVLRRSFAFGFSTRPYSSHKNRSSSLPL
ncbi:hypothetical protein PF007_g15216 [Phytophthora fragariae]|uniref:Uncharacterized protein n=2 Tax=Phytophthora fragariae TaxID=53985 RepID=A0A6A3RP33_9STRA|nr:hypothetical protein PF007_g15216 [Phytophthora fragariae]KAE9128224.1 hypothetical protein PF006_g16332 [Phytophthora fragariae]